MVDKKKIDSPSEVSNFEHFYKLYHHKRIATTKETRQIETVRHRKK